MKFESGYNVATVFDGSKLGIEPYSIEVLPNGELLILDSANSNLYRISSSLSLYSRPRLVAGSAEGYSGHVDGKPREARINHPKGITVDDRGNIYSADTANIAIKKLSDAGVTTIVGGKWGRGGGHVDGPSGDAKFSDDFDVVYIGRIAMLLGAGFFGYMLALLQRRVGSRPREDELYSKCILEASEISQATFYPNRRRAGETRRGVLWIDWKAIGKHWNSWDGNFGCSLS
uniref:NHL repeat-containing protein n=1 Tax=Cannabis sativa TaxID=3483 RepID=A0A803P9Q9_CANSA